MSGEAKRRLHQIDVNEVSIVDAAANLREFVVVKRLAGAEESDMPRGAKKAKGAKGTKPTKKAKPAEVEWPEDFNAEVAKSDEGEGADTTDAADAGGDAGDDASEVSPQAGDDGAGDDVEEEVDDDAEAEEEDAPEADDPDGVDGADADDDPDLDDLEGGDAEVAKAMTAIGAIADSVSDPKERARQIAKALGDAAVAIRKAEDVEGEIADDGADDDPEGGDDVDMDATVAAAEAAVSEALGASGAEDVTKAGGVTAEMVGAIVSKTLEAALPAILGAVQKAQPAPAPTKKAKTKKAGVGDLARRQAAKFARTAPPPQTAPAEGGGSGGGGDVWPADMNDL